MNQLGLEYITEKCHNETPWIASLYTQKCLFFFFKNEEQEGKTGFFGGWRQWEEGRC
jgi:hypothetical protein